MSEGSIKSNFAGDRVFFVIGNRCAFVNFTPPWCCAGDVEKGTDQLRLPYVAMSNDGKIANKLCSVDLDI